MIAGSVSAGVLIILLAILVAVCAFLIARKYRRNTFSKYKTTTGPEQRGAKRVDSDAAVKDDEHDEERDSIKRAPTHVSEEREKLLRQRTRAPRDPG